MHKLRTASRRHASITSFVARAALVLLVVSASSCYKFGGSTGFPSDLKTVAILPFDNQTASPDVQRELNDFMRRQFQDRLNLRDAPEDKADVIVRGIIGKYDPDLPVNISADPSQINVSRRKLQIVIDVTIDNMKTGKPLLKASGLLSEGTYAEGRELDGRKIAIESMVDQMIQKSQSQW